jgi:hypothetical protein
MTEAVFFHRASATLIVTDLIENFEAEKLHGRLAAPLYRLGGVLAPAGATPRDLRPTFWGHRRAVRAAAARMIGWAPARIVPAHGAIIAADTAAALRRAFRWTGLR